MSLYHILLILCLTFTSSNSAKVLSTLRSLKTIDLFGDHYTLGTLEVDFDQELVGRKAITPCSKCTITQPPTCPPCYFTPTECAGSREGTNCSCLYVGGFAYLPCFVSGAKVNSTGPGVHSVTYKETAGSVSFNFVTLPPLESCTPVVFSGRTLNSAGVSLVLSDRYISAASYAQPLIGDTFVNLCPEEQAAVAGTQTIQTNIKGPHAAVVTTNFQVQTLPSTETISDPVTCEYPTGITNSTHLCLSPGVRQPFPINYGPNYLQSIVVPIPSGCFYLSHGGDNLATWMSFTDPYVNGSSTDPETIFWDSRPLHTDLTPSHRQMVTFLRWVCRPAGQNYLYAQVLLETQGNRPDISTEPQVWFGVTNDNIVEVPFSSMTAAAFSFNFMAGITLTCGEKTFSNLEGRPIYFGTHSGTLNLRMMWPEEDPHYFWPVPQFLNSDERLTSTTPETGDLMPKKIKIGVILDWDRATVPNNSPFDPISPRKISFLTEDEFQNCSLKFHGQFAGADDGIPINATVRNSTFKDKEIQCDYDKFTNLTAQVTEKLGVVLASVTIADILNLALSIDVIENTDDFYACLKEVQSRITTYQTTDTYFTDTCVYAPESADYLADQCCNPLLSGYLNCSNQDRTTTVDLFASADTRGSDSPDCTSHLLEKFQTEQNRVLQPEGCRDPVDEISDFRGRQISKYVNCRRQYMLGRIDQYTDGGQKACVHDDDCSGGICTAHKYCAIPIDQVIDGVIQCVIDNLDGFVLVKLKEKVGAENISVAALKPGFQANLCSDKSGVQFYPTKQAFILCGQPSGCKQGFSSLLAGPTGTKENDFLKYHDIYDMYPFGQDCLQFCSGSSRSQYSAAFRAPCTKGYCNWYQCNPATETDLMCQAKCMNASAPGWTPDFCGLCEDHIQCVDFTSTFSNQSSCENAIMCILANGTTIYTATEADCNSVMSCDYCAPGVACNSDQLTCEGSDNGFCTDATDQDIGLWVRYPFNTSGACLIRILNPAPFDQTRPADCVAPAVRSVLGQDYCFDPFVTEAECGYNYPRKSDYTNVIEYSWKKPATTETECKNWGSICFDAPNYEFSSGFGLQNAINKPTAGLEACTGRIAPMFNWTTGRWKGGQVRKLEWRARDYDDRRTNASLTVFDWSSFSDSISDAVTELYGLRLQDEIYCSHAQTNILLDSITCLFQQGSTEKSCLLDGSGQITSISSICSHTPISIPVPPFTLNFTDSSIGGDFICERVTFSEIQRLVFRTAKQASIAILLVNYNEDTNFTLRNTKQALYGRVQTNGISYKCARNLTNVTIHIKKDYTGFIIDPGFPVLDVAIRTTPDGLLTPLSIQVNETDDAFIFHLDEMQNGSNYFVITRVESDWFTINRTFFSNGALAYLSIILTLYAIGVIISFAKIILSGLSAVSAKSAELTAGVRLVIVLFTIFSFFLFRTVLFSLVLEGAIVDTESPAVGYVLIEFPIVLFFSFVTQYIVLWYFLVRQSASVGGLVEDWVRSANLIVLLTNLFILAIFIVMIILFETIVTRPALICSNEVSIYDSETAFIILMVYRAIFSTFSITLGLLLFAAGTRLLNNFNEQMETGKKARISVATIAGTFGLIAQGIYYLVITATRSAISNYVTLSILLVVEIIPAYTFLMLAEVSSKVVLQTIGTKISGSKKTSTGSGKN